MTRDTGPHDIRLAGWISCAPFERLLGIEIESAAAGSATLSMPFARELAQGMGLMHGGALMTLADTALVMAIKSLLPPGSRFATVHAEIEYLQAVTRGLVTARARVRGRAGKSLHGEAQVMDDAGATVAMFRARFRVARDIDLDEIEVGDVSF